MSRLTVAVHGDANGFNAAMKSVKHSLADVKGFILGAFSTEKIIEFGKEMLNKGKNIEVMSNRLHTTIEETQVLSKISKEAGSSIESMETAYRKVALARAKALKGDGDSKKAFAQLKISQESIEKDSIS